VCECRVRWSVAGSPQFRSIILRAIIVAPPPSPAWNAARKCVVWRYSLSKSAGRPRFRLLCDRVPDRTAGTRQRADRRGPPLHQTPLATPTRAAADQPNLFTLTKISIYNRCRPARGWQPARTRVNCRGPITSCVCAGNWRLFMLAGPGDGVANMAGRAVPVWSMVARRVDYVTRSPHHQRGYSDHAPGRVYVHVAWTTVCFMPATSTTATTTTTTPRTVNRLRYLMPSSDFHRRSLWSVDREVSSTRCNLRWLEG